MKVLGVKVTALVVALFIAVSGAFGAEEPAALYQRGFELQKAGKLKQALDTYEQCLEKDPEYYLALLATGTVYFAMQEYHEAAQRFEITLMYHPDDRRATAYLSYSNLQLGLPDEAKAALESMSKDQPEDPAILIALGWGEYLTENRVVVPAPLKKALELNPENKSLRNLIALLEDPQDKRLEDLDDSRRYKIGSAFNDALAEASIALDLKSLKAEPPPPGLSLEEKMAITCLMNAASVESVRKVAPRETP